MGQSDNQYYCVDCNDNFFSAALCLALAPPVDLQKSNRKSLHVYLKYHGYSFYFIENKKTQADAR